MFKTTTLAILVLGLFLTVGGFAGRYYAKKYFRENQDVAMQVVMLKNMVGPEAVKPKDRLAWFLLDGGVFIGAAGLVCLGLGGYRAVRGPSKGWLV